MAATGGELAWPFAVGAGRRLDFRTVCAPDFLVASGEYGVLADRVVPADPDGPPEVLRLASGRGHQLGAVFATRVVTSADLDAASGNGASGGEVVRDDHGRPLELAYGFVVDGDPPDRVDPADLRVAFAQIAPAYARFLDDEEGSRVMATTSFVARSSRPVRDDDTPVDPLPARYLLGALMVAFLAVFFMARALFGGAPDVLAEYDRTLTAGTVLTLDDGTVADRPTTVPNGPYCPAEAPPDVQVVDGIYACPGSRKERMAMVDSAESCRSGSGVGEWQRQVEAAQVQVGRRLCIWTADDHRALVTVADVRRDRTGLITSVGIHVVVWRN